MKQHYSNPKADNPDIADHTRLIRASIFLAVCLGMLVPFFQSQTPSADSLLKQLKQLDLSNHSRNSKIYPVIIEQEFKKPAHKDQFRALSEFNTDGAGGITTEYGFHTLSNTDIFQKGILANEAGNTSASNKKESSQSDNDSTEQSGLANDKTDKMSASKSGMHQKIPTNYRFKQHMALRYDGNSLTAIATESMPGASYFRNMIRQIRMTFSPPGQNYIIRDPYGYSMNQAINPQVVAVQFAIHENGYVSDVKVVSSIGQQKVDQACVEVLQGKNFGPPPPEIFRHGNIFGINFIFPDLRKYR